jgi:hypothetical protein
LTNGVSWTIWDGYGPHGNTGFSGSYHDLRNFGGQQFDAKAMYLKNDANYLYIGLVTGADPNGVPDPYGRQRTYKAGDFAINPDFDHQTSQYGILLPTGPAASSASTTLMHGGTWWSPDSDVGWAGPPYANYKTGGTSMGNVANYMYTALSYNGHAVTYYDPTTNHDKQIYLYEARVSMNDIGLTPGHNVNVSWAVSCNNDFISGSHTAVVPEPASLAGIGGSLLGWVLLRFRRRKA